MIPAGIGFILSRILRLMSEPPSETCGCSEYVCVDIETTGLSVRKESVIEVCAYLVRDGRFVDRYCTLVHPENGRHVGRTIERLTGISQAMVDDAPSAESVFREFVEFVGDRTIVGHNIKRYDMPLINNELERLGMERMCNPMEDTMLLARKTKLFPSCKLGVVADSLGIFKGTAHRAEGDVQTTAGIYEVLVRGRSPSEASFNLDPLR